MPSTCSAFAVNRIVAFRCPETLKTAFNAPDHWFDEFSGKHYLVYRPNPGEYTILREGQKTGFQKTSTSRIVNVRMMDTGFTLQLTMDDMRFRYLFEELTEACLSSDFRRFTPITVLDFVDPGREAFKQALLTNGNPYRTRYGLLEMEATSGSNGVGTDLYGVDGFRVVFRDMKGALV